MILATESLDIAGPAGPIRALLCLPLATPGAPPRQWTGVLLYSDIFQLTPPMVRTAQRLAGHGFVVVAPELYGRNLPGGTALDFDQDRKRALDCADGMTVEQLDADRRAVLDWLQARSDVDRLCVAGWCFGGHLALRAALENEVAATACFYGTGIHSGRLGASSGVDTLERAKEITGRVLLGWGRQDPHVPFEGRVQIREALEQSGTLYTSLEYNGAHAFMRDEGPRYNPVLANFVYAHALELFKRKLGEGDQLSATVATETKH